MDNDIRNYPFYYAELVAIDGCEFLKLHGNKGIRHFPLPFKPYTFGWSDKQAKTEYRDAVTHQYIEKLEFETTGKVRQYGWNFTSWESDISYVRRFMLDMDLKITKPRIAYVDIETYDKDGVPNAETQKILCIGIVYDDGKEEYLSGDEKEMIETFVSRMENIGMIVTYNGGSSANHRDQKSGAMIFGGVWSSTAFDLPFIATRYEVLGLGSKHDFDVKLKHIDFVDLFITHRRETKRVGQSMAGGYSLDNVCKQVLGVGKIERKTKVADMSPTDLMEYNMRDIRILKQFDEKMKYTALRIGLAQASNSCLVRWQKNHKYDELSPLIMIDNLCIRECNKRGLRCKAKEIGAKYGKFVGAYVKEPKMGIYKGVQNYDFMQLYPSIMIRDKISFDRDGVVVPEILKFLMAERKKLKERYLITKSDEDYIMQYAYKVFSNSVYGSYGSPYFRFYDEGKAQQITLAGQKLLKDMIKMVEGMGYNVQYGDTDSIFIDIEKDKAEVMAELINKEFDPINVEVGEYYESIIFVGTEQRGTKKRYTGLYIEDGKEKITTKGFEYIKRDFTVAGKEIMMSLVNNILHGATYTEVMKMFEAFKTDLRSGKHDDKLIMAKGVKNLNEYVYKEGHSGAPHVRALRKLIKMGHAQPLDIHYVFTKPKKVKEVDPVTKVAKVVLEDTEPIIGDVIPKGLDYDRYVEQVKRVLMQLVRPLAKSEGLVLGKKGSASHSLDVYISS